MGVTLQFVTGRERDFPEATSVGRKGAVIVAREGMAIHSFDPASVIRATLTGERGQPVKTITWCICGRELQPDEGEKAALHPGRRRPARRALHAHYLSGVLT